ARRAIGEVRPVFAAAVGIAAQVYVIVNVHADLAPEFGRAFGIRCVVVAGIGQDLAAVVVEGADVVDVGWADDLELAVVVDIAHANVLVVGAPAVAGLAGAKPRPAGARRTIRLQHGPLIVAAAAGPRDHDLHRAVAVQVV